MNTTRTMRGRASRIAFSGIWGKRRLAAWSAAVAIVGCSTANPSDGLHPPDSGTPPAPLTTTIDTTQASLTASTPVDALTVSFKGSVNSLIASTGNLYWTSHRAGTATVWRAGKGNVTGQEIALYSEQDTATTLVSFTNFVYAKTTDFFGYFVASYFSTNAPTVSFIKRVPLTGGPAVTLATVPAGTGHDLATDQATTLYWTDDGGVRKMAINGGAITTLYAGTPRSLGIDASNVYFGAGSSIFRVPIAGGAPVQLAAASFEGIIGPMYVDTTGQRVYWGDGGTAGGTVHSVSTSGGAITTYQTSSASQIMGVGSDGTRVFWTQCYFQLEDNRGCVLRQFDPISGATRETSTDINQVTHNNRDYLDVQWDASSIYFATGTGVNRTCVGPNFGLASCGCDAVATACTGVVCGPTTNNCFQTVTCPSTCVPPSTCSNVTPNTCCVSSGNPCGDRCGGQVTDNCGNVFNCNASCGLNGLCPCRGGKCDPTSNFCDCSTGPCL